MAPFVRFSAVLVTLAATALAASCGLNRVERRLVGPQQAVTLDSASPYLKAHLKNGSLYVLSRWRADTAAAVIVGTGQLFDPNRAVVDTGEFHVPLDSVALFETNVLRPSHTRTALTVMAGITAAIAGLCATSPKTCFGSCPTFYAPDSTGKSLLVAEGFSSSIAPALEATDVDMLPRARALTRDFTVRMTNEAFETHVIRWADLLIAPRPQGGRVFVTPDGQFHAASDFAAPVNCMAAEGDCRSAVGQLDGRERSSLADSTDLGAREIIDLEFSPSMSYNVGLVITARQTLLTTFLIYQSLAYMGHEASRFLAALETAGPGLRERARGMGQVLGRIEALVQGADSSWVVVGTVGETGPLASDTKILPLPASVASVSKIRLRLTRGLWRIDYVALATLGAPIAVQRLQPQRVRRDGRDDPVALATLRDSARVLTTMPGDAYELTYRLPAHPERYELFLEARGYYLEWMRREWFAEEDHAAALGLLLDPANAMRRLAPAYKRVEPDIERLFWNSRYVTH